MRKYFRTGALLALAVTLPLQSATAPRTTTRWRSMDSFSADLVLRMGQVRMAPETERPRSTFQGRCSQPANWVVSFDMDGQSASLGALKGRAEHCSYVITWKVIGGESRPDSIRYEDGRMFLVTMAGDTLRGVYGNGVSAMKPDGTAWFRDDFALMGGSGAFELATGSGVDSGTFAPGIPSPMRAQGTINYRQRIIAAN